jgi:hypothetical protein
VGETELNVRAIIYSLVPCLLLGAFLFGSVWNCVFMLREVRGWRRWIVLPSGFLVAFGALAFFGQGISAVGGLNWLPPSFEWPAGHVNGVLTTDDGRHIVLIQGAGRIQVYDSSWRFLRGWPAGTALKLRLLEDGTVEALSKGLRGFVFDLHGKLISQRVYGVREMVDLENSLPRGDRIFVPTSPWLYAFSSPFFGWLVGVVGMLGWFVANRKSDQSSSAKKQRAEV